MLVLSRKPNEKIVIDGDIEVTLLEVDGNKVRLGIKAPKDVKILRQELVVKDPVPEGTPEATTPNAAGECGGQEARKTA